LHQKTTRRDDLHLHFTGLRHCLQAFRSGILTKLEFNAGNTGQEILGKFAWRSQYYYKINLTYRYFSNSLMFYGSKLYSIMDDCSLTQGAERNLYATFDTGC